MIRFVIEVNCDNPDCGRSVIGNAGKIYAGSFEGVFLDEANWQQSGSGSFFYCPEHHRPDGTEIPHASVPSMAEGGGVILNLCDGCTELALRFPQPYTEDGWIKLPAFCSECGAKVAQIVRLLLNGGKVVFPEKESG